MIWMLVCFCGLVDDGLGCVALYLFDVDVTLSMTLDSQSDTVGFDEVYDRTRREQHKVNRRSHRHRCDTFGHLCIVFWLKKFQLVDSV